MRYPPEQKAKTHRTILDAAARVFRRQGYQGGGVEAVMKEAGLTHGGFYAHFRNKEALLAETLTEAMLAMREKHAGWTEGQEGAAWLRAFLGAYLSPHHRVHAENGCPAPALVSELDRVGEAPKQSFERVLTRWADDIARHLDDVPEEERQQAALGAIAACVGGVALARAVADREFADRVLRGARNLVLEALAEEPTTSTSSAGSGGQENPS